MNAWTYSLFSKFDSMLGLQNHHWNRITWEILEKSRIIFAATSYEVLQYIFEEKAARELNMISRENFNEQFCCIKWKTGFFFV